jgi:hypothetical protein
VIDSLFSEELLTMSPRIASLYVHNGAKVFARWASSLAEEWEESMLPTVKRVIQSMIQRLEELVGVREDDIELSERVGFNLLGSGF